MKDFWEGYVPEPVKPARTLEELHHLSREVSAEQPAPVQEPVAFVKGWNCGRLEVIVRSLNQKFEHDQPLYITPPAAQRTWVGLTDDEIDNLSREMVKGKKSVNWLSYSIEAKLRSKNEDRN